MIRPPPRSTPFPTRRSSDLVRSIEVPQECCTECGPVECDRGVSVADRQQDRKSTRLNSSHLGISYAVFCLKKKKQQNIRIRCIVHRGSWKVRDDTNIMSELD